MFTLAVFIGIYSYALMALGLAGVLTWGWIWGVTGVVLVAGLFRIKKFSVGQIGHIGLMGLIGVQAIVNLVGALGPERGFDALWYHLPIPKIWLASQKIFFIGGNLYYSAMPKLIDMLYVWGETPAKIMHLVFGLLSLAVTYKLARKWLDEKWSMLAAVIFYSNLVVGWQSTTAYIDLGRTFFEALAFYLLLDKKIYKSAIVLGLAMATKTLAIGSLGILGLLVLWETRDLGKFGKFVLLAVLVAAPWYVFSFVSTGNPVYPIFFGYKLEWDWGFNLLRLADPINPIYVIVALMLIVSPSFVPPLKLRGGQGVIFLYCVLSFVVWYLTPRSGGGRFLLPYLPVWSVAAAAAIAQRSALNAQKFLVGMVIAIAVISIGYRAAANAKFLPIILGKESLELRKLWDH